MLGVWNDVKEGKEAASDWSDGGVISNPVDRENTSTSSEHWYHHLRRIKYRQGERSTFQAVFSDKRAATNPTKVCDCSDEYT